MFGEENRTVGSGKKDSIRKASRPVDASYYMVHCLLSIKIKTTGR
jgi:hypothetical protein